MVKMCVNLNDCLEVSTNVRHTLCIENELKIQKKHQYGQCRNLCHLIVIHICGIDFFKTTLEHAACFL